MSIGMRFHGKPFEAASQKTLDAIAIGYPKTTRMALAIWFAHDFGYRVTESGEVISFTGKTLRQHARSGLNDPGGFMEFTAVQGPGRHAQSIPTHRFQAYQVFGDISFYGKLCIRHLDGNRRNNARANLGIWTLSEMRMAMDPAQKERLRIAQVGRKRKLDMDSANDLRYRHSEGQRCKDLAKEYGISLSTVSQILTRKIYDD